MKAILISVNFETEDVMWSFVEGEHPIDKAHALWESIEDDWPGYASIVLGDEEAKEAHTERLLQTLGFPKTAKVMKPRR